jgi:MFS family permease
MAVSFSTDSEKCVETPSASPASSISDLEEHSPGYDAPTIQKYLVVFVTSFVTMTASFSSTSLMSAATQIADEYGSHPDIINASNAGLLIAMGLSPFVWSPLINLIGRLYTFNACIFMLLVWTIAASVSPNLACFITFRVLSGFQGTFFHVTSQSIIAEYFPPVQRGTATGFFLAGTVLGPPLGKSHSHAIFTEVD